MARVPYIDRKDLPPSNREQISDHNIARALANSPGVVVQSGSDARFIRHQMRLDPRLRELAIIQVGYSAGSAYEYAHHIEIGLSFGVSEADIRAIAEESGGRPTALEPLAKAVLRAAREITVAANLSDETFAALRAGLDNERIVELIYAIATYNGVVRLLASLRVDIEDDYRKYLDRFPLPAA